MKITNVKPFIVNAYRTNFVFVKVETDAGLSGIGEGTLEYKERALIGAINDLAEYLLEKDPLCIEKHVFMMYRDSYWRMGAVLMSAISAVEMALWDIAGKYHKVPVYALMGGAVRDQIKMYANGWFAGAKSPDEFALKAKETVTMGVTALKWDPFGKAYLNLEQAEFCKAIDCVAAVRDAVGNDVELLIECHGRLNPKTAVQVARALVPYSPMFLEEPVPPDNLDALAAVHRASPIPIAAGERIYSIYQCREFLEKGCADYFQPDVSHCGGISAVRKMAAMAEPYYIDIAPHNPSGPIANAATLQLAGCMMNFRILEIMINDVSWRSELTSERVEFFNGHIKIPCGPGLSLELHENACAKYPFRPISLRHYNGTLTDVRPASAATTYYFKGISGSE